jgi:hypothetical protein
MEIIYDNLSIALGIFSSWHISSELELCTRFDENVAISFGSFGHIFHFSLLI